MGIQFTKERGVPLSLNQSNVQRMFELKSNEVGEKLNVFKEMRDELNSQVRVQLDKRNEINRQVKELITEVQKQKAIRNEANGKVADLRKVRLEKTQILKSLRSEFRNYSEKIHRNGKKGN